jgi:hypothetical protein
MTARQYIFGSSGSSAGGTNDLMFGRGKDGDLVVSLNATIAGDRFYNNLTIDAGVTYLLAEGSVRSPRKLFVKGTLTVNGIIRAGVASPATANNNGFPTGDTSAAGSGGSIGGSANGGTAVTGGTGNGGPGIVGGNAAGVENTAAVGGNGGDGFGGRTGGIGAVGGAGGGKPIDYFTDDFWRFNAYSGGGSGGGSGGAGGGDGVRAGGAGGFGGAGGSVLWICAHTIIIGAAGSLTCYGSAGQAGGNGTAAGNCGGGGGGAGGAGGLIFLGYNTLTNNGTISAQGGNGGAGGVATGTGVNGEAGDAGAAGRIYKFNFSTGEYE